MASTATSLSDLAGAFEEAASHAAASKATRGAASSNGGTGDGDSSSDPSLPTPLTLYRASLVLHSARAAASSAPAGVDGDLSRRGYETLAGAFADVIESLPGAHLGDVILREIGAAFASVVKEGSGIEGDQQGMAVAESVRALCGLCAHSTRACRMAWRDEDDNDAVCVALAEAYDQLSVTSDDELGKCILETLSSLLLQGLISPDGSSKSGDDEGDDDGDDDAKLRRIMEAVKSLSSDAGGDKNPCLGDLQIWQAQQRPVGGKKSAVATPQSLTSVRTLASAIRGAFPGEDNPQRDYLLLMLESAPTTESLRAAATVSSGDGPATQSAAGSQQQTKKKAAAAPGKTGAEAAVDRLIRQVRDVLPSLGEGYVETALACYSHDASRTTSALLEAEADPASLHPRLRALDRSLPRRKREGDGAAKEEAEARQLQKERMRSMEKQAEAEAYALGRGLAAAGGAGGVGEYDDDYDDQYDGLDPGRVGGADGGKYDVDLDAVKTYNRAAREEEKEAGFWEESRNTNRESGKKGKKNKSGQQQQRRASDDNGGGEGGDGDDGQDGEKKFRGPDKGRGGRLIGPDGKYLPFQKGGKKKKQQQQQAEGGDGNGNDNDNGEGSGSGGRGGGGRGRGGRGGGKKGGRGGGGGGGGRGAGASAGGGKEGGKGGGKDSGKDGAGGGKGDNMSKIQKRRKDANKAKVGNHHRKEGAARKAAKGM